ncbi:MAG TPA: hypothetical protein VFV84_11345 [Burkholderiales bacterium]|nr:hypothetical protein [Burkholderiales bacterium]
MKRTILALAGAVAVSGFAQAQSTVDFGTPLAGFADVGYQYSTNRSLAGDNGFNVGNLDFYLTPSFGDRVRTLAELVFEVAEDGSLATDLERLQIGYAFSDAATAWMGRFHTPYGYWNTAYHHGAQLQTSVSRPTFINFEDKGGILPAHAVGLWGTGAVRLGTGWVRYDAYLANGNDIQDGVLDFNQAGDDNGNTMVGGRLGYQFGEGKLRGLLLGIHGYREDVAARDDTGVQLSDTRVNMLGGYFHYEANDWEAIGEYYRFRNDDLTGGTGTHTSWAAFVQVGRLVADRWTPYFRWEKDSLDQTDPYFASMNSGRSYQSYVAGLRFDLNYKAALKAEAYQTDQTDLDVSYSGFRAQFAIRF